MDYSFTIAKDTKGDDEEEYVSFPYQREWLPEKSFGAVRPLEGEDAEGSFRAGGLKNWHNGQWK